MIRLARALWALYGAARLRSMWNATMPTRRYLRTQLAVRFGPPVPPWGWLAAAAALVVASVAVVVMGRLMRDDDDTDDTDDTGGDTDGGDGSGGTGSVASRRASEATLKRLQREVAAMDAIQSAAHLACVVCVRYAFLYLASALEMAHGMRSRTDRELYDALMYTSGFMHRFLDAVALAHVAVAVLGPILQDDVLVVDALRRFAALHDPVTVLPLSLLACASAFMVHWKCYPRRGAWAVDPHTDFAPELIAATVALTLALAAACALCTAGVRALVRMGACIRARARWRRDDRSL